MSEVIDEMDRREKLTINKEPGLWRTNNWLQQKDSEFLSVLRSLSIFIIVFGHVGGFWFWPPWSQFLHVFVPIFFFISGAVSYNAFLKVEVPFSYLKKRLTGLLIPYYCVCVFSLIMYLILFKKFPTLSLTNLLRWMTIIPNNEIMTFPLGQVWFLHTLAIIFIASPILFLLYERHSIILVVFLISSIIASVLQLKYRIGSNFIIAEHDLFKPFVHSLFFCLGFFVFDSIRLRSAYFSAAASSFFALLSVLLVKSMDLNPNYDFHTYSPDIYYVAGSLSAIWVFILLQTSILRLYSLIPLFHGIVRFLFRHTFAIFLLHSFAIFFVEEMFGLVNPQKKTITYGIIKLIITLAITLIIAPSFTKISSMIVERVTDFDAGSMRLKAKR